VYKYLSRRRHRTTPFRSTSALLGLCFFALSIVAPAQIQKAETRIFSQGLKVTVEKTSPAFAALQDDLREPVADVEVEKPTGKIIHVSSGQNFSARAEQIIADNKREEQIALQKQMANAPKVHVVEISREELLQTLFLPLITSLKKTDVQTAKPVTVASSAGRYERNEVTYKNPIPKPDSLSTSISVDPNQPHQIRGLLEFTNGLALTSPTDEIHVFQEVEGEVWSEGSVWLQEARYSIEVPNREGLLVAELRTAEGELMGRGELELAHLQLKKRTQYKVSDVTIKLYPVANGLSGSVLSAYSHDEVKKAVASADVEVMGLAHRIRSDKEGHFEDEQVLDGSNAIIQVQRTGYWGSLAVGVTKQTNELVLYPNKMLKAFMSFAVANDPTLKLDQDTSLVWGRVTRNGKAVAGAKVDLMTTDKALTPIYFNELMIPDPNLKATSANGLYAFLPVPPGAHAVQVSDDAILSEPVIFPTEARHVSTINIETASWKRMVVKSFDAFSSEKMVAADLYRLGFTQERKHSPQGTVEMKFSPGSTLLAINAIPSSEYVPSRVTLSRNKTFAYFPMVKTQWLKALFTDHRLPGTSIAVGFVQSKKSYRVHADGANTEVIYFNARGERVEGSVGVGGGGYVIINLDTGFRTISVIPMGADSISSSVVLADSKFVNLINHVIQ
jgi:hypothetical protein